MDRLNKNRWFVIALAIVLVIFWLLNLQVWRGMGGLLGFRGLLGLPVLAVLAVFLVRGHRWARWCLLLWFLYGTVYHFIGWAGLWGSQQDWDAAFRFMHLVSLIVHVLLVVCLLVSRRLREHVGERLAPKTGEASTI